MRRELVYAVVGTALGAGIVLFAASRTWTDGEVDVSLGVPSTRHRTGDDVVPWLTGVALVALAGAGALLATRGFTRLAVGGLLAACGMALAGAGLLGLGRDAATWWPALALVGGLAVTGAGVLAVIRGRHWPGLGARYDRGSAGASGAPTMWDALDRGEDPTR